MTSAVNNTADKEFLKKQKEIRKWEKEKAKPKSRWYLAYLVMIISLVYITDEIASQIGTLMKTETANDMLAHYGESSVGMLDLIGMISIPFMAVAMLYKPLSDKFGRKKFLVINTLGMGVGMLFIYLSRNIAMYIVGYSIIQFFVPHDMQVVYIMESAPPRHRAKIYSLIKCIATLGVFLVPLLRKMFMTQTSEWRRVYLIPALVGIITSGIALLFAKETDAFIDQRLRYLSLTPEEISAEKQAKKTENAQGGLINAFRFVFRHKQLKWIMVALAFANVGMLITMDYEVIMNYGYASDAFNAGAFAPLNDALEYVGVNEVTAAAFLFPVGSAFAQVFMGFIADGKSRRAAALFSAAVSTAAMIGMWYGSYHGFNPYLVGFFSGVCIGGFWALGDIIIMMAGESAPTNLRSSVISSTYIGLGAGAAVSYLGGIPLVTVLGNGSAATICLCLMVPGAVLSFLTMLFKVNDTTGLNLDTVTGCEWD